MGVRSPSEAPNTLKDITLIPEEVVKCYLEPHRKYHTLEHIYNCLNAFHDLNLSLKLRPQEAADVIEAIWYHDSIYVVGAKDNEIQSAMFARRCGVSTSIQALILATIYPSIDREYSNTEAAIIDADLYGLSTYPSVFDHHTEQVKAEYLTAFTEAQWNDGRGKFLQSMLDQPHIYQTSYARSQWEPKARENIKRELTNMITF